MQSYSRSGSRQITALAKDQASGSKRMLELVELQERLEAELAALRNGLNSLAGDVEMDPSSLRKTLEEARVLCKIAKEVVEHSRLLRAATRLTVEQGQKRRLARLPKYKH